MRQRGRRLTARQDQFFTFHVGEHSSMDLVFRWRILVTKDLPSHLDRLVLMVLVDHLVHMAPAVDHLVTHPDLLSSPAQAREQPARRVRWTQTMWSRRTEASGSGLRSARSGSGRQRPEPSRFVLHISIFDMFPLYRSLYPSLSESLLCPPGSGSCPGLWLVGLWLDNVAQRHLGSQDLLLVFPHSDKLGEWRAGRCRHWGCSARRRRTRSSWKQRHWMDHPTRWNHGEEDFCLGVLEFLLTRRPERLGSRRRAEGIGATGSQPFAGQCRAWL